MIGVRLSRHEPIPDVSSFPGGPLPGDPKDWTPGTSLRMGRVCRPQQGMFQTDFYTIPGVSLNPFTADRTKHPLHLPGREMMEARTVPWAPWRTHLGGLEGEIFMADWIRIILQRERETLEEAGIYEAVFLSLFEYRWDMSFFRSLVERWSYVSNTVYLLDQELTISPMEFHRLSGLPVFGAPYDEYTPNADDLRPVASGGSRQIRSTLRQVFQIYSDLSEAGDVTFGTWIQYFAGNVTRPVLQFAYPIDPFGTGKSEVFYSGDVPDLCSVSPRKMDRVTYLTAFLAWWLSYFVVPCQPKGLIRPDTFIMANMLARGQRVSLAIPAIANIFRCMRILSTSLDPSYCNEVIPFHYLCRWAHMYWSGLYAPLMDERLLRVLPVLAEIAGVVPNFLYDATARRYFCFSSAYLRSPEDRVFVSRTERKEDVIMVDVIQRADRPRGLLPSSTEAEFLVSIRHGLLPLRMGDRVVLEPYMPHRCANQFGLDQEIPAMVYTSRDIVPDLAGAARCWAAFLRLDTRARFTVPSTSRIGEFSAPY